MRRDRNSGNAAVDSFDFERFHETLSGQALSQGLPRRLMLIEMPPASSRFTYVSTRLLDSPIGKMNQPRLQLTVLESHLQCLLRNAAVELAANAPTHQTLRVHIQNHAR